jgi:hypothetical protein
MLMDKNNYEDYQISQKHAFVFLIKMVIVQNQVANVNMLMDKGNLDLWTKMLIKESINNIKIKIDIKDR